MPHDPESDHDEAKVSRWIEELTALGSGQRDERMDELRRSGTVSPTRLREIERRVQATLESTRLGTEAGSEERLEMAASVLDDVPEFVGPYRVLRKIGEGGMGTVLLAEQREPVLREVAIKLVRSGLDSREVARRFDQERRALAAMNHDAIARVFDAGATASGRPYVVMEYVDGLPIDRYCDAHALTIDERLELMQLVCDGVQHAHRRGVMHRDLKPTNILVTTVSGRHVPKLIDFGLARATDRDVGQRTLYTEFGAILGTPEYMSPEQARGNPAEIDTRTDVYSLGVILYQLLCGRLPFTTDELRAAGLGGVLDLILRTTPKRPTSQLVRVPEHLARSAKARSTDGRSLIYSLKGDLDWIVMKALEKDPTRRYDSPASLAADLERHRHHEPVEAGPPNLVYRLRKFVRRRRGRLGVALAVLLTVLSVSIAWYVVETRQAERVGVANERFQSLLDEALQQRLAAMFGPRRVAPWDRALETLERCVEDALPEVDPVRLESAREVLESTRRERDRVAAALESETREARLLERLLAVRIPGDESFLDDGWQLREHRRLAKEYHEAFTEYLGVSPLDEGHADEVLAQLLRKPKVELAFAFELWGLAEAARSGGRSKKLSMIWRYAERLGRDDERLETLRPWLRDPKLHREELERLARDLDVTAFGPYGVTLVAEALVAGDAHAEALALCRRAAVVHAADFGIAFRVATLHAQRSAWDETIAYLRVARGLRPDMIQPLHMLGSVLLMADRAADALPVLLHLTQRKPDDPHFLGHLAHAHDMLGHREEARIVFLRAWKLYPNINFALEAARLDEARGNLEGAEGILREALAADPSHPGVLGFLGVLLVRRGKFEEAVRRLEVASAREPRWLDTLGFAYLRSHAYEKAAPLVLRAAEREARRSDLWLLVAEAREGLEDLDGARAALKRAVALDASSRTLWNAAVNVESHLGKHEGPVDVMQQLVGDHPEALAPKVLLVQELFQAGRRRRAVTVAQGLFEAPFAARDAEWVDVLGSTLSDRGYPLLAEGAFRYLLQLDGTPKGVLTYKLGNSLMGQGRIAEAIEAFREALRLEPDDDRACNNLCILLDGIERTAEARRILAAFLARREVYRLLVLACQLASQVGEPDAARRFGEDALRLRATLEPNQLPNASIYTPAGIESLMRDAEEVHAPRRALVDGGNEPASTEDLLMAARLALRIELPERALALYDRAVLQDGTAADHPDVLHVVARAALRISQKAPAASRSERARARAALERELDLRSSPDPRQALRSWEFDPDFASVRDEDDLARLSEDERASWATLWEAWRAIVAD